MRLSREEAETLKNAVQASLSTARVWLFGSRVDDAAKGGDIDILVAGDTRLSLVDKSRVRAAYWRKFGERKIDLVSIRHGERSPFVDHVLEHAIEL